EPQVEPPAADAGEPEVEMQCGSALVWLPLRAFAIVERGFLGESVDLLADVRGFPPRQRVRPRVGVTFHLRCAELDGRLGVVDNDPEIPRGGALDVVPEIPHDVERVE